MGNWGAVQFIALIPVTWCFVSWVLSRLSGWSRLARHYRTTGKVEGESAHLRTAKMGVVNYHSCLSFRVNDDGLRMAVAPLFRLGHPPLFIPWNQFHHIAEDRMMYSQKIVASVGRPTLVRIVLPGWVRYRMPAEMRPVNTSLRV